MRRASDLLSLQGLQDRDRRAILIGLMILVPALLYVAAVRPYMGALSDLSERTEMERALLQREEALLADADALLSGAARSRAEQADLRLVHAPNAPLAEAEVTGMLETLAALNRVLLQEMSSIEQRSADAEETTALQPLRLAVRGESDLEGVLTFLQAVEMNPLLLRVMELSIEPARDEDASGVVQFSMIIEAFTQAPEVSS